MTDQFSQSVTVGSRQVTLVDENDQQLGVTDVWTAHRYPVKLHRAASVWWYRYQPSSTVNSSRSASSAVKIKEVLLQQRSQHKLLGAGWWGNAVCGNVRPDESYLGCGQRRLREELGFFPSPGRPLQLTSLFKFHYQAYGNKIYGEHEIDQVWIGEGTDSLELNPKEVSQVIWIPVDQLNHWAQRTPYPTASQTLSLSVEELRDQTAPPTFNWLDQQLTIAPWTMIMLKDKRLSAFLTPNRPEPEQQIQE